MLFQNAKAPYQGDGDSTSGRTANRSILIFAQMFAPETGAASNRLGALSSAFAAESWRTTVLTQLPNYPTGRIAEGYRGRLFMKEQLLGATVFRFHPIFAGHKGMALRSISEIWFCFVGFLAGLFLQRHQVVYATSPSFFTAFGGYALALLKRAAFVWEVRDLTWRYASDLGKVKQGGIVAALESALLWVANRADQIVVTNPEQRAYFLQSGVPAERIKEVFNGVDPELMNRSVTSESEVNIIRVLYGGLIGYPQGLGVLLDVAVTYRNDPGVEFVCLGEGAEKATLVERAKREGLSNVRFLPGVPRIEYLEMCAQASILFAHLRNRESLRTALPSKLFEYMAVGRPIIYAGAGAGAEVLDRSGAGVVVQPENPEAIREAIERLRYDATLRNRMGLQGRHFVLTHFNRTHIFRGLVKHLESFAGGNVLTTAD